jgi:hypothetical protein
LTSELATVRTFTCVESHVNRIIQHVLFGGQLLSLSVRDVQWHFVPF